MPKHIHHTFEGGGVAVWRITETSDELYACLATSAYDAQLECMTHESRRAEWLATRLLVKELFGSLCEVAYHPTGRPFLKGCDIQISISHTRGFAAVVYHRHERVGIDIERVSPRVERIASRFTSSEEASYIDVHDAPDREMYHLLNWSAKETLYKLFDTPSMADFKKSFRIAPYRLSTCGTLHAAICDAGQANVEVCYQVFPEFVCTFSTCKDIT